MMHRAWSSIVEVPYCFSRSSVKFQGHAALKIVEFDPNWAFPDSNSSSNSQMAMKCCTKLETAKERCPIVFQGHPSNFKVTRDKTSPNLTQIGCFWTIGRSQLSNPSDLPCCHAWAIFGPLVDKNTRKGELVELPASDTWGLSFIRIRSLHASEEFSGLFSKCFAVSTWRLVYTLSRLHNILSSCFTRMGSLWPSSCS